MASITTDVNTVRQLFPKAIVKVSPNAKYIEFEIDLRHEQISEAEHDAYFPVIKHEFKERLIERYSYSVGWFKIYIRYEQEGKTVS